MADRGDESRNLTDRRPQREGGGWLRPGSVIILHDGEGRGERTAEVLRRVLPELRERGLEVVSLGELVERGRRGARQAP